MGHDFVLHRPDLTGQAYELLKESVLSRGFRPNERLPVEPVGWCPGIRRLPARDELMTITPRVGFFAPPAAVKSIRKVFSVRKMIKMRSAKEGLPLFPLCARHEGEVRQLLRVEHLEAEGGML